MTKHEVIGDEDIPDGSQQRYQQISQSILAALLELGSEKSSFLGSIPK
jgi:hypothetical protein